MSKTFKVLDCTLRDGGYYTNWDFDLNIAKQTISSLANAGVDLIELGYKSNTKKGFYGSFKYCQEQFLGFVKEFKNVEFAFMLDAAEFVTDTGINNESLDTLVKAQKDSVFSWVRIASHLKDVKKSTELVNYLKGKGYSVCFNLMGGSLISEEDLVKSISYLNSTDLDVFYVADSFGSFYPSDIKQLLRLIKANFAGEVGIHLHDNQGMAYANAIMAMEEGVDIIDGTVTGIGRGAGNLLLEQFLLGLKEHFGMDQYKPDALLDVMNEYYLPLKLEHAWGYNYSYMFSGANNIHQMYCQTLRTSNRFTPGQIYDILNAIPKDKRVSYKPNILEDAIQNHFESKNIKASNEVVEIPKYTVKSSDIAVVIGGGRSLQSYKTFIHEFLNQHDGLIIETNDTGQIDSSIERDIAILNKLKLNTFIENKANQKSTVVTGEQEVDKGVNKNFLSYQPFHLGQFEVTDQGVNIPDYDAGMFAISIAVLSGASKIFLLGFDGLKDNNHNKTMDVFFKSVADFYEQKDKSIEIISLTPTEYKNVISSNIFAYLNRN